MSPPCTPPIPIAHFRQWLRGSLTNRITFAALTLSASVTLLILGLSFGVTRTLVETNIEDALAGQARLAAHRIEAVLNGMVQDIDGLADNALMVNAVDDPRWRETYLLPFLRDHRLTPHTYYALHLIGAGGEVLAGNGPGDPATYSDTAWGERVLKDGKPYAGVAHRPPNALLVVAIPVRREGEAKPVGMVVGETSLSELFYNEAAFSERKRIILRERHRPLISWDEVGLDDAAVLAVAQPLRLDPPLEGLGLTIEVGDDRARLLAPLGWLSWAFAAVLVVTLLIALWWSRVVSRRLARPICALSRIATRVSRGGLEESGEIQVRAEGEDEVASLAGAFDLMLEKLRDSHHKLELRVDERTRELNEAKEKIEHDFHIQQAISQILRASLEQTTIDEKLEHALEVIFSVPWFNVHKAGSIFLRDENEPDTLVMHVERGLAEPLLESCARLPFGKCLCGRAAARREVVYSDGIDHEHEIAFDGMENHGHICLPIQVGGKVLGVVNLYVEAGLARPDHEIEFLNAIANALASTLERQRAEDQERRLGTQLAHMARLSTMGEIATTLSHELNQPLATIVNFAGGSLRRIDNRAFDADSQRFALTKISEQAKLAGEIIRRVRAFVRKGEVPYSHTAIDINEVVEKAVELVEFQARRGETVLELHLDPALEPVPADRVQIQQILVNLILNAVEAMGELPVEERRIRIRTLYEVGEQAHVLVHDNGNPPADLELERLFDPFYTTKASGMGMGLAICATIIEAHQGRIWASRDGARGLTFHFTLPCARGRG
ncbi:sensor histidine kinase [Endothiovibrio diazotrophicus]